MKWTRPGSDSGNGSEASKQKQKLKQDYTPARFPTSAPSTWPSVIEMPVEISHRRPMRSTAPGFGLSHSRMTRELKRLSAVRVEDA